MPLGTPTLQDHTVRLQLAMCCIGSKGDALATKLKLGYATSCDINNLALIWAYWDILRCYDPTATNNCLTQVQVDAIWDAIACYCGICFSPYGMTYQTSLSNQRITEAGQFRETEDGNSRIIE